MRLFRDQEFPGSVLRVLEFLDKYGFEYNVRSFETPAHHAGDAAELLRCPIGAVVKSLVFVSRDQNNFVLVLVSGQNRADSRKLTKLIGHEVLPAKPKDVFSITGYPVGAVPPFGVVSKLPVIIDQDLMKFQYLWSSAGSAHYLVNFESTVLKKITGGKICDIKEI